MLRLLLLHALTVAVVQSADPFAITNSWNGGFQGKFTIHPDHVLHGWKAHLLFQGSCITLEIWKASEVSHTGDGTEWIVQNMAWDGDLTTSQDLEIEFICRMNGDQPLSGTFYVEGLGGPGNSGGGINPGGTLQTHTSSPNNTGGVHAGGAGSPITAAPSSVGGLDMKYNYPQALGLSILFFNAQRSGRLPANNPIPWRGDSAVNDNDNGHDLSGGWYDAGDHVKFNLPMSFSTWVLAYGFLKFKDAYDAAGQKDMMCDMMKWPLDYFLKCWIPAQNQLYVQVGEGHADHGFWGRPENMNMARPAYKIDSSCKGSDVAGDTVSALASGYMVFKDICGNTDYANQLLTSAKSLYVFAKSNRGIYTDCMHAASEFYGSSGEADEMSAAAAWLYTATKEEAYLTDAKSFYPAGTPWGFAWNDANSGAALLLYEATKDGTYKGDIESFIHSYMPGGGITYTPCGLAWRNEWGPNRYAANAAFVALAAAELGIRPDEFKRWAMTQINYLLGDNKLHISYEIGFGTKYPQNPHHRGSSCRTTSTQCDIGDPGPNPNILKGALVGGPDQGDNYDDRRGDYVKNEVACDYNAGFHSALAGLTHFAHNNALPPAPAAKC